MLVYLSILGALAAGASFIGGESDDTIHATEGDDTIDSGLGDDSILGGLGDDILSGGDGDDWILGGGGHDQISGGAGNDFLAGDDGNDIIDGGLGFDTVYAGDGNDTLTSANTSVQLFGNGDQDWIEVTETVGEARLDGGEGNDVLIARGSSTLVQMNGGDGSDILYAEQTSARLTGGAGSDFFVLGDENDADLRYGSHSVDDFEPGIDQLVVPLSAGENPDDFRIEDRNLYGETVAQLVRENEDGSTTTIANLWGHVADDMTEESLVFMNEDDVDAFLATQDAEGPELPDDVRYGGAGSGDGGDPQELDITEGDDLIELGAGDFEGSNSVDALGGNDTITSEDGQDALFGGEGDDLIISGVEEYGTVPAGELYGSEINGDAGNDTLVSQAQDYLTGGEGEDTFVIDHTAKLFNQGNRPFIEDFEPGVDTIVVTLPDGFSPEDIVVEQQIDHFDQIALRLESETLERTEYLGAITDAQIEDVEAALHYVREGNLNAYIASNGASTLEIARVYDDGVDTTDPGVQGGDQTLTGTAFDDTLFGGLGEDSIFGDAGHDWIVGDDGSDTIDGDAGRDTVYAGDGNDLIRVEGSYNEIIAGTGDDILWTTGGGVMTGGDGEDYFLSGSGHMVITDFDPAEDTIVVPFDADGDYTIAADPESGDTLLLSNGTVIVQVAGIAEGTLDLPDIAFLNEEETYAFLNSQGASGPVLPVTQPPAPDNVITGTGEADTLDGTAGDDIIFGGDTGDLINAGAGNDMINAGTDLGDESQRQTYAFYTPAGPSASTPLHVINEGNERLDPDTVFGGAGDDTIVGFGHDLDAFGGDGDDLLVSASTGIAQLEGGLGNDTLVGEGGTTAESVVRFNNQRFADFFISEASLLSGGDGDDTIVTAENTNSIGGEGTDTFIVRDPSIEGVSASWNVIRGLDAESETLMLTYTGETAPSVEDVEFDSVRIRDLPLGAETNPTSLIAIQVNGATYGYVAPTASEYGSSWGYNGSAILQGMLENGQIQFVRDDSVTAIADAASARAALAG